MVFGVCSVKNIGMNDGDEKVKGNVNVKVLVSTLNEVWLAAVDVNENIPTNPAWRADVNTPGHLELRSLFDAVDGDGGDSGTVTTATDAVYILSIVAVGKICDIAVFNGDVGIDICSTKLLANSIFDWFGSITSNDIYTCPNAAIWNFLLFLLSIDDDNKILPPDIGVNDNCKFATYDIVIFNDWASALRVLSLFIGSATNSAGLLTDKRADTIATATPNVMTTRKTNAKTINNTYNN